MDIYTAINPLYHLSKLSGLAIYTYTKSAGYTVTWRDKLQAIITTTAIAIFIIFLSLRTIFETEGVMTLTKIGHRFVNTFYSLLCYVVMNRKNRRVIENLEKIDAIDKQLKINSEEYTKIRKATLFIIMAYFAILSLLVLNDFSYCISTDCAIWVYLYFFSYYICYTINASVLTLLCVLLFVLKRRFQLANRQIRKTHIENIKKLLNIYQRLRSMSRDVNNTFQGPILGRVVVTSMDMIHRIMAMIAYTDIVYFKLATLLLHVEHTFEIVGIIYCFSTLRKEVRNVVYLT